MNNPTSLDKQGIDEEIQYRSVIFYQTNEELKTISNLLQKVQKYYAKSIVTQVLKLEKFYKAEDYHQKYFKNNPSQAYCRFVIVLKLEKNSKSLLVFLFRNRANSKRTSLFSTKYSYRTNSKNTC